MVFIAYAKTPQENSVLIIMNIFSRLVTGDISPYPTVHIVIKEKNIKNTGI